VRNSRHHLSPPCHYLNRKVVTAKMQTGSGFQLFRHDCHYLIDRLEENKWLYPVPYLPLVPTDMDKKVVTVVTDSRKRPSDAAFSRHHLDFQVVTCHYLVVTD